MTITHQNLIHFVELVLAAMVREKLGFQQAARWLSSTYGCEYAALNANARNGFNVSADDMLEYARACGISDQHEVNSFAEMNNALCAYDRGELTRADLICNLQCTTEQREKMEIMRSLPESVQGHIPLSSWDD